MDGKFVKGTLFSLTLQIKFTLQCFSLLFNSAAWFHSSFPVVQNMRTVQLQSFIFDLESDSEPTFKNMQQTTNCNSYQLILALNQPRIC